MSDMTQGGGIIEAAANGGFPLSPQQRRLWALHQADPAAPWRAQMMVRLNGDLDAARLRAAIGGVVARYEVLRTSFPCPPGMKEPIQVVGGPDFLWEHTSAPSGLSAAEREAWIESLWHGGAAVPPDLERGPVLAASLVTLEPSLHLLSLRLPALCADAASLVRLASEVAEAYASVSDAGAEEPLQYADLASWQNELLDSGEEGRAYWRRLEIGPSLAFALPFQAAGSRTGHAPRLAALPLSADLAGALAQRAEVLGAPLPSLLLAGWLALLSRLSGEREIAVGVAFDGRSYDGLAEALGPLARYLPLPMACDPDQAFSRLVAEVQRQVGELYERQEFFCWEDLPGVGSLAAGYTAAFDFTELPPRRDAADLGLTLERLSAGHERAGLRLSWTCREGALRGELHYDEAALERADALRIGSQLATLLAGAAAAPETPLARLPVLTPDERRWLLFDLNDTARLLPEDPVYRLFEVWADRTPEATALVFEEERLTFAEVEERSNQLAHHLRVLGVKSEVSVALLLPRSHQMVVAILAVLKAGGCYVPLDPGYPAERLRMMLDDSGVRVLVARGGLAFAAEPGGLAIVHLDEAATALAAEPVASPRNGATAENLAYIVYTSGSTGRPKGVMVA
ncbi:MAG TPA: AMP-binding protein, partial [Thermoanaerobaculia bacterium]|nr:AMP-binding protein [Thermoanaerobaculia bacterium]